jgi:outer membrane cobalamin receptor
MPTETKKRSDLRKHYHVDTLPVLIGTAAIPKSRIPPDPLKLRYGATCCISRLARVSFLALMLSHSALGDEANSDADDSFNRIIVTATRTAEDESQIGSAFSQLTEQELETEQIANHVAFTFRAENLADQHYYTTIGYPALGTAVFFGAEVRF